MLTILTLKSCAYEWFRWKNRKTKKLLSHQTENDENSSDHRLQTQATNTDILKGEKEAANYQKISLTAFGFSALGFVYPPFRLLSIPILSYNYYYFLRQSYYVIFQQKKTVLGIYELLSVSGVLLLGNLITASMMFSMFFTARKLILQTEKNAQIDLSNIFGKLPNKVWVLKDDLEAEIHLHQIQTGDILVVRAGEMIAADGRIIDGEGTVDQCMLTGESQPVEKNKEDPVYTSTILLSGWLHIQVEKKGQEAVTGQVIKILKKTASSKNHVQSNGERIVEKGAGISMLASIIVFPILGPVKTIALSYAGFGYQMRIGSPLTLLNHIRLASKHGILIKDGRALERLVHIDTVIFDKTGTLTKTVPNVQRIVACNGFSEKKILAYAATAEQRQKHPIALAIFQAAAQKNIDTFSLKDSDYEIGFGIRVNFIDPEISDHVQTVFLGSQRFMQKIGVDIPSSIKPFELECAEKGHSLVYLALGNKDLMGVIELEPSLRENVHEMIHQFTKKGLSLYIISGDQQKPTQNLAKRIGIKNYYAEALPEDKAKIIENLQKQGRKVCFFGDGINDAVALLKADVAVSLNGAATIAMDAAEIVLMKPDLSFLPYLFETSDQLNSRIKNSIILNNISGLTCVIGVILFGMGVNGSLFLFYTMLGVNMINAQIPLLKEK